MKVVSRVLLIVLSLLTGFQQALIFVHFKLNREAIEQAFCVNKDKPDLQCHGTCYLKKQLQKTTENPEPASIIVHPWMATYPSLIAESEAKSVTIEIHSTPSADKETRYKEPGLEIAVPPPIA